MLRRRERDQIRQIKEPVRTHIPEIRRWFLSQPSGLKGATPSWRIWAARSPNDFFNGLLGLFRALRTALRAVTRSIALGGLSKRPLRPEATRPPRRPLGRTLAMVAIPLALRTALPADTRAGTRRRIHPPPLIGCPAGLSELLHLEGTCS